MTRNKHKNKLDKPIPGLAKVYADRLIASYGIDQAEQVAKLGLEKIRANKQSLERKYGK